MTLTNQDLKRVALLVTQYNGYKGTGKQVGKTLKNYAFDYSQLIKYALQRNIIQLDKINKSLIIN